MVGKYAIQAGCSWRKLQQSKELAPNPVSLRWRISKCDLEYIGGDHLLQFLGKGSMPRRGRFKVYSGK